MADAEIEQERRSVENAVAQQNFIREQVVRLPIIIHPCIQSINHAKPCGLLYSYLNPSVRVWTASVSYKKRKKPHKHANAKTKSLTYTTRHTRGPFPLLCHAYVCMCMCSNMRVNIWMSSKRKVVRSYH